MRDFKVVACMATFPGREDLARKVASRIAPQVDLMNICFNEYEKSPEWVLDFDNVVSFVPFLSDMKDLGKFVFRIQSDDLVFMVDDDIDYPEDYVEKTIERILSLKEQDGIPTIFGYHGIIYKRFPHPIKDARLFAKAIVYRNFSPGIFRKTYDFWEGLDKEAFVDQIGSGTLAAFGINLPSFDYMRGSEKMVDVRLAKWAYENGVDMVCLPRERGWMSEMDDPNAGESSIYREFTRSNPTRISREIRQFAFKRRNDDWLCRT